MIVMLKKIVLLTIGIIIIGSVLYPIVSSQDSDDVLEVLIIAGQSNAAYRNENIDVVNAEVGLPSTSAYYYGTDSSPIFYGWAGDPTYDTSFESYALHSMVQGDSWKVGGYEAPLAKYIGDYTGHNVLIINVGISSAAIDYLLPSNTGGEYVANVIARALDEIPEAYKIHKLGVVWAQGESDTHTPINTYLSKFNQIQEWYAERGFSDWYLIQTRETNGVNSHSAQVRIVNEDHNVIFGSTAPDSFTVANGLMESDNLHYTQKGRIVIADDIEQVLDLPAKTLDYSRMIGVIPVICILLLLVGAATVILSRNRY